jgi:hypothetical protein
MPQQVKSSEVRQLETFVKDERRFDATIGEEKITG